MRYQVRKATQAITARRVPGGPLLIHKLVEARYRHHSSLMEAARRHSGLPPMPLLRAPPDFLPLHPATTSAAAELGRPPPTPEELEEESLHEDSVVIARSLVMPEKPEPEEGA